MNRLFYKEWCDSRVNKIFNILGKDWFAGKKVLELGACYGDIGMAMARCGAEVLFTDARSEHLAVIPERYSYDLYTPRTMVLDQNHKYDLNEDFDLVLHLGTLYNLDNWAQDLVCALNHAPIMFLETVVNPEFNAPDSHGNAKMGNKYGSINCRRSVFTQESVERVLIDNGCKFIRLNSADLNTGWSWLDNHKQLVRHVYDWNYDNASSYHISTTGSVPHYRRMWLVIR